MTKRAIALTLFITFLACKKGEAPAGPDTPEGRGASGGDSGSQEEGGDSASASGSTASGGPASGGEGSVPGGAGGENSLPTERAICDGSSALRFGAAIPLTHGQAPYASGLFWELGLTYILINGRCEYVTWSKDPATGAGTWAPVRTGVLDKAAAGELAEAFSYSEWAALQGFHQPSAGETMARGTARLFLFDGEHHVVCQTPCAAAAPRVQQAAERMNTWVKRLYAEGEDLDGPVRLRVFEVDASRMPRVQWPLTRPVATFVTPHNPLCASGGSYPDCPTNTYGSAHRIDDADELAALRSLRPGLAGRADYAAEAGNVPHENPTREYRFAFRDVTPFENDDGQVPGLFDYPATQ